jgi:hypothetical protein
MFSLYLYFYTILSDSLSLFFRLQRVDYIKKLHLRKMSCTVLGRVEWRKNIFRCYGSSGLYNPIFLWSMIGFNDVSPFQLCLHVYGFAASQLAERTSRSYFFGENLAGPVSRKNCWNFATLRISAVGFVSLLITTRRCEPVVERRDAYRPYADAWFRIKRRSLETPHDMMLPSRRRVLGDTWLSSFPTQPNLTQPNPT